MVSRQKTFLNDFVTQINSLHFTAVQCLLMARVRLPNSLAVVSKIQRELNRDKI